MRTTERGLPDRRRDHVLPDPSQRNTRDSALFRAISVGRRHMVRDLLASGSNVHVRNARGQTVLIAALHITRSRRRLDIFTALLAHGANPVPTDIDFDRDALAWTAVLGRVKECHLILDEYVGEVNLTKIDVEYKTALHHAVEAGLLGIVRLLVKAYQKYDLSVDVKDGLGLTPLMHAQRLAYMDIARLLENDGGACRSYRDPFRFKNSSDWYNEGVVERRKNIQREFSEKDTRDRILGRVVRPKLIPIINIVESHDSGSIPVVLSMDMDSHKEYKYGSLESLHSAKLDYPSDADYLASFRSLPTNRLTVNRHQHLHQLHTGVPIHSLLDITSEQGAIPTHFHRSTARHVGGRVGALSLSTADLMDILADQKTASFRVPYRKKVVPLRQESVKGKAKVSSLAIIMGKQRKRSTGKNPKLKPPTESVRKKTPDTGKRTLKT